MATACSRQTYQQTQTRKRGIGGGGGGVRDGMCARECVLMSTWLQHTPGKLVNKHKLGRGGLERGGGHTNLSTQTGGGGGWGS